VTGGTKKPVWFSVGTVLYMGDTRTPCRGAPFGGMTGAVGLMEGRIVMLMSTLSQSPPQSLRAGGMAASSKAKLPLAPFWAAEDGRGWAASSTPHQVPFEVLCDFVRLRSTGGPQSSAHNVQYRHRQSRSHSSNTRQRGSVELEMRSIDQASKEGHKRSVDLCEDAQAATSNHSQNFLGREFWAKRFSLPPIHWFLAPRLRASHPGALQSFAKPVDTQSQPNPTTQPPLFHGCTGGRVITQHHSVAAFVPGRGFGS
jgi:hypothetical protein